MVVCVSRQPCVRDPLLCFPWCFPQGSEFSFASCTALVMERVRGGWMEGRRERQGGTGGVLARRSSRAPLVRSFPQPTLPKYLRPIHPHIRGGRLFAQRIRKGSDDGMNDGGSGWKARNGIRIWSRGSLPPPPAPSPLLLPSPSPPLPLPLIQTLCSQQPKLTLSCRRSPPPQTRNLRGSSNLEFESLPSKHTIDRRRRSRSEDDSGTPPL